MEDCRDAALWLIKRLNETAWGDLVKITDTTSKSCISIITSRNVYEKMETREWRQEFLMAPADLLGRRWELLNQNNLLVVSLARPSPFYLQIDNLQMLEKVSLAKPHLPCDRFSVEHGSLLVDPSQPFHVAGETITVLCDPGYGVKTEAGYSQYFTTVCSPNLETPKCVDSSLDERLFFERTVVMSSIVFM